MVVGSALASVVWVYSVMHVPDVNPLVRRLVNRVDSERSDARTRFFAPDPEPTTCIEQNRGWKSVEIELGTERFEEGHVINALGNGQAVLIVITRVNLDEQATRLDLLTSLEATGVFVQTAQRTTFIEIEPPATMAQRLRDPVGQGIERISICYVGTGEVGASPSPIAQPTDTPEPTETSTPTSTATESPTPTLTTEPTETPVPTASPTQTPEPTATETAEPTATATFTPE